MEVKVILFHRKLPSTDVPVLQRYLNLQTEHSRHTLPGSFSAISKLVTSQEPPFGRLSDLF
jgi:hypothetical protein